MGESVSNMLRLREAWVLGLYTHLRNPDISIPGDVHILFERVMEAFGRVDVLFNNAGWEGPSHDILDYSAEELAKVYNTNIVGMILAMQSVAKLMIGGENNKQLKSCMVENRIASNNFPRLAHRPSLPVGQRGFDRIALPNLRIPEEDKTRRKVIINSSSIASTCTKKNSHTTGWYVTTKAAVDAATRVIAGRLEQDNVHVYAINPGAVETKMAEELVDRLRGVGIDHVKKLAYNNSIGPQRFRLIKPEEISQVP